MTLLRGIPYLLSLVLIITVSTSSVAEDRGELPPVVDSIERLYREYEAIYEGIKEIEEDLKSADSSLLTPVNITIRKDRGFKLVYVELRLNNRPILTHLYNREENLALELGARQLLYDGALKKGPQDVSIVYRYRLNDTPVEAVAGWRIVLQDEPFLLEIFFRRADNNNIEPVAVRVYLVDEKEQ